MFGGACYEQEDNSFFDCCEELGLTKMRLYNLPPDSYRDGAGWSNHFKLSSGGRLGVQLICPPPFVVILISNYFPRQRGTMNNPFGAAIKPSSDRCINEIIFLPDLADSLHSAKVLFFVIYGCNGHVTLSTWTLPSSFI